MSLYSQVSVVPASLFSPTLVGLVHCPGSTYVSIVVTHRSVSLFWASTPNAGYLIDHLKGRASSTKYCGVSVPQIHTCACTHLGTHSRSPELELPQVCQSSESVIQLLLLQTWPSPVRFFPTRNRLPAHLSDSSHMMYLECKSDSITPFFRYFDGFPSCLG